MFICVRTLTPYQKMFLNLCIIYFSWDQISVMKQCKDESLCFGFCLERHNPLWCIRRLVTFHLSEKNQKGSGEWIAYWSAMSSPSD